MQKSRTRLIALKVWNILLSPLRLLPCSAHLRHALPRIGPGQRAPQFLMFGWIRGRKKVKSGRGKTGGDTEKGLDNNAYSFSRRYRRVTLAGVMTNKEQGSSTCCNVQEKNLPPQSLTLASISAAYLHFKNRILLHTIESVSACSIPSSSTCSRNTCFLASYHLSLSCRRRFKTKSFTSTAGVLFSDMVFLFRVEFLQ